MFLKRKRKKKKLVTFSFIIGPAIYRNVAEKAGEVKLYLEKERKGLLSRATSRDFH